MPRALVIENDPKVVAIIQARLKSIKHDHVLAGSKDETLKLAEEHEFDYVIARLRMAASPGEMAQWETGFECIRALRTIRLLDFVPIIVIVEKDLVTWELSQEINWAGGDYSVVYPFPATAYTLAGTIQRALKRQAYFRNALNKPKTKAKAKKKARRAPAWPDPKKHTHAKIWITEDGAFNISTKTNKHPDGKARFLRAKGKPTNQMQYMMTRFYSHPKKLTVRTVLQEVYPELLAAAGNDPDKLYRLKKILSCLNQDIRLKKLENNGINPDIMPVIGVNISLDAKLGLNLASLRDMDKKP